MVFHSLVIDPHTDLLQLAVHHKCLNTGKAGISSKDFSEDTLPRVQLTFQPAGAVIAICTADGFTR